MGYETMEETKNGVKRESLATPWYGVASHLIEYITYEGVFGVVYSYHLNLLYKLRYYSHQKSNDNLSILYLSKF